VTNLHFSYIPHIVIKRRQLWYQIIWRKRPLLWTKSSTVQL